MFRFFAGVVVGIWIAQNYNFPDIGKEFYNLHQKYIKEHQKPR